MVEILVQELYVFIYYLVVSDDDGQILQRGVVFIICIAYIICGLGNVTESSWSRHGGLKSGGKEGQGEGYKKGQRCRKEYEEVLKLKLEL